MLTLEREQSDAVEVEKLQKIKEEIKQYKLPPVLEGQPVQYFWQATANSRAPCLAWVTGKFGSLVHLYILADIGGPHYREAVRHMSDPKLKLNQEQRENGAWDYTPHEKERMRNQKDLDDRLRTLELALIAPIKNDREILKLQAKKLGLKGYSKMKSEVLRNLVIDELKSRGEEFEAVLEAPNESVETAEETE